MACRISSAWEAEALRWQDLGIRVVINRIGLVLASHGGGLPMMLPPFRKGFAPYFGRGRQVYPWIHLDDMCKMVIHEVENEGLLRVYNAAAPFPVDQKDLNRAIAESLGRRVISMPVPRFVLSLFLGERAGLLADSWRLSAEKISKTGFTFQYPHIDEALKDLLAA
ncbi:MAG: DUF1731 domain-containing protein [Proteobacteria bacterium]|nr:DUF1731 domain-containing protein [Pseudomonadota bacterium]